MRRPTQVDVAKRAGVSRATVSYVINGQASDKGRISPDTVNRVMQAVAELGYEPDAGAQALRTGSSKTIGLIIPDLHNPHFWENAEGVEQGARQAIACCFPAWTRTRSMAKISSGTSRDGVSTH